MRIGKLYKINEYYWVIYPSIVLATNINMATIHINHIQAQVMWWSEQFKSEFSHIGPESMFVLLEQVGTEDASSCKILTEWGKVGWICINRFIMSSVQEVNQ
jgi:hypothetical protein